MNDYLLRFEKIMLFLFYLTFLSILVNVVLLPRDILVITYLRGCSKCFKLLFCVIRQLLAKYIAVDISILTYKFQIGVFFIKLVCIFLNNINIISSLWMILQPHQCLSYIRWYQCLALRWLGKGTAMKIILQLWSNVWKRWSGIWKCWLK